MQFQSSFNKILLATMLLGSAVSAFGESAETDAAQAQAPKYDFTVTTAIKDKMHPHFGEGIEAGYVINGEQGRTLVLTRGKTYTFDIDTGVTHDFYFSSKPKGWGMDTVTAGVKGQFTYKGVVTFTPTAETPDVIYAACRNHKFMGGEIHIVNPDENDESPQDAEPADEAKQPTDEKPASSGGY